MRDERIPKAAFRHFKAQFNLPKPNFNPSILECITEQDNANLNQMLDEEEIKNAVMSLSAYSTAGPDGYNREFYRSCWEIIIKDVVAFVIEVFKGKVSPNQSSFVKDRLIYEKVLVAQEIIHKISDKNKGGNVVIKLDMAKAYDRICRNHNIVEAYAAHFSITWCIENGYTDFTLELDSLMLADLLRGKTESNYKMATITEKIAQLRRTSNIDIVHCYREANQLADSLAKMASKAQSGAFFFSGQQLPKAAKGPFQLDKSQIPSIRIKYDKANFFVS
ncbi:uncharacterized protein LOC142172551 [Nicotiana tabacum]|uniref:Uncharacterized protein LOC142172551 n=1 Tax=Nicotiana tabacum TaxID=4097 RepID=A0AC58T4Y8_TOBAC